MVQTKEELLALLREHQVDLQRLGVRRCGLFGSFLHGKTTPHSDVDVLVEFEPGRKSFDSFMALVFFLEELLGRPVDLITTESLSPHIGPRILQEVEYVAPGA